MFAQPDLSPLCCMISGSIGYGLFWYSLIVGTNSLFSAFGWALLWFLCIEGAHFSWMLTDVYVGRCIYFFWFILIAFLAVLFASFSTLTVVCIKKRWLNILWLLPGLWLVVEIGRFYYFLSGLSLDYIGWPLAATAYGRQFGSFFGWAGCSLMVIATGISLAAALRYKQRSLFMMWLGFSLFPYILGGGYYEFLKRAVTPTKEFRVAVVQPASSLSLEQGGKNSALALWKHFVQLLLSIEGSIDLLIFPEVAVPFAGCREVYDYREVQEILSPLLLMPQQPQHKLSNFDWMHLLATHFQCPVLLGLERWEYKHKIHYLYNAAECVTPDGLYCGYDKRVLVPGGEYIPCGAFGQHICSFFFPKNTPSGWRVPGSRSGVFSLPSLPKIGISICYEETFGSLLRSYKKENVEVLVNLTNDGWYPCSRLPRVHFYHGILRNQELGLPCVRACLTGVTAVVDSLGRVVAALPFDSYNCRAPSGVLQATVPVATYTTLYSLWGDIPMLVLAFLSLGIFCILLLVRMRAHKKNPPFRL